MATRMQQRRGTAAQWTAANPILAAGEIGFETDTSKFKMGNGSSAWSALTYFANAAELSAIIDGAPAALNTLNELAAALGDDPSFFTNMAQSIADNIDSHNVTTSVHGIANTALLATLTNVSTAQTGAESFATTAVTNHSNDTTQVHGIDDTSVLATATTVATAVGNALTTHNSDTSEVHGIADTALLATKSYADTAVSTHASDVTEVHGIANTADLATKSYADTAVSTHSDDTLLVHGIADTADLATKSYADTAVSTHAALTENIHGIADTSLLATQDFVATAVSNSEVDQSALAGVGIDWNATTEAFDIDSTVATTTHVSTEIGTHNSDTTSVHGIADTSLLATTANVATAKSEAITAAGTAADTKVSTAVAALTKSSVGLGNVDNTADSAKPVSTAVQTALDLKATVASNDLKAPLASPALTGTPTAPTAATGTNTTQVATTGFVQQEIAILTTGAPGLLNTLDELAAALGDDANYAATVTTALTAKAPIASPTFTGTVTIPAGASISGFAPLASPALTGTATAVNLTVTGTSNMSANGIQFSDGTQTKEGVASRTPIIQKTDSYTLSALTERDSLIEVAKSTATTVTIPTDATLNFPIGTSIDILQTSTGQVTIAGAGGVTVNSTPGLKLRTTWSSATLFKRAANTWVVYGDLTA